MWEKALIAPAFLQAAPPSGRCTSRSGAITPRGDGEFRPSFARGVVARGTALRARRELEWDVEERVGERFAIPQRRAELRMDDRAHCRGAKSMS